MDVHGNSEKGIRTFAIIWFGQVFSLVGTGMTRFGLLIWAYQQTEQATTVALLGFFSFVSIVLFMPFAGTWIDRYDRRLVMLVADSAAGFSTIAILFLLWAGGLQIWHLFALSFLSGAFEAFQRPAYTAATTLLIPKSQYSRMNGIRSLADYGSQVLAPFLAGVLLQFIGIEGILLIDVVTFLIAVATLSIVRVPNPDRSDDKTSDYTFRENFGFATKYLWNRKGLLGLMLIFAGVNLFATLTYFSILPAMVLARSGGDEVGLASVQAILGVGGVLGSVIIGVWGLRGKMIHYVLIGMILSFFFGDLLFAIGRGVSVWLVGAFIAPFFIPFIIAADRTIWQSKVPPPIQGRIFSVEGMFRRTTMPLGYLLAGPLADQVFEPAMIEGGTLAENFGWLVGTGPGAGMGLMFACTAILGAIMALSGYLIPAIRNVEEDLPDWEAA